MLYCFFTGSYISAEASATFIDVGLVKSLTRTLQLLDLDHADTPKVVTALVKALELVTKEYVQSADSNGGKNENQIKPPDPSHPPGSSDNGDLSHSIETSQPDQRSSLDAHIEAASTVQMYGGSEAVTDDMEHDQDLGGEDDYMHETSEEGRDLENGMETVGIRFEIQPHVQENIDEDDDEEMSGDDDGEEVDEDEEDEDDEDEEEEQNDLEEDDVHHHLPHPDTDQDDHEIDDDEFDEEVIEEEDDDDEDDEDGVILRLEEGINGINVFDHIEVFGRDQGFPNETLHVMPVEVFGSRRQGRTTSIYNLLGRGTDNGSPSQHPLLLEPSAVFSSPGRQTGNSFLYTFVYLCACLDR